MLVGHEGTRARLERALPPVTLLTGLSGIGKWVLAEHLIAHYGPAQWDTLRLRSRWGVREARAAGKFSLDPPIGPGCRIVAADLEQSSHAAQTALLKTLEEPSAHARFILVAPPGMAIATVASRAQSFNCSPLTWEQTRDVLEEQGLSGPEAAAAVSLAPGRPGVAMRLYREAGVALERVQQALGAAREGNARSLDRLFRKWSEAESRLLGAWVWEASTGNWRVFSEQDAPKSGATGARRILQARVLSNARPQIADRRTLDFAMQQQLL